MSCSTLPYFCIILSASLSVDFFIPHLRDDGRSAMNTTRNKYDIINAMMQVFPPGSGQPQDLDTLYQLSQLTSELIASYQTSGLLHDDPFHDAWTRKLHLYESEIRAILANQVVLVTGGEGCVGSHLIAALLNLGVKRIVSVDKARCGQPGAEIPKVGEAPNLCYYAADVRHLEALRQIFVTEKPAVVFHLAALRHPGLAERAIHEAVTSNVFGTQHIIQLCEEFQVQQCIFSSTGKASRYFTAEVYAASKKIAEWLFAIAAQTGHVRYGMVRFTHMLDNSMMRLEIEQKVQAGQAVNLHGPDRYVLGQNVGEAVHLLLNALVFSEPRRLKFLLVRQLGWPTENVEVALYNILKSGKTLPVYFQGVQPGYEESFFHGQLDWEHGVDINTLINALETGFNSFVSSSQDMIVGEVYPFAAEPVYQGATRLRTASINTQLPESVLKQEQAEIVRTVSRSSFMMAPPQRLLQILKWGVNPKSHAQGEFVPAAHQAILELLLQALVDRVMISDLQALRLSPREFLEILAVLKTVPSLANLAGQLEHLVRVDHTISA